MNWAQLVAPMFGLDNVMLLSLDILKKYHHEPKSNTPERSVFVSEVMEAFKRYDGDSMEIFDMCCRLWSMTIKARTTGKLMRKLYNVGSAATVFDLFNLIRIETKTALSLHQCQQFALKILNVEWKNSESVQDLESKLTELIEQLDATSDSIDGSEYVPQEHLIVARLMNQAEKRPGFNAFIVNMRIADNIPDTWAELLKLLRSQDYRYSLENQSKATLNTIMVDDSNDAPPNTSSINSIKDGTTTNSQPVLFNTLNHSNHQESMLASSFENLNFNSISVDTLDMMQDHLSEITMYKKLQDQRFNKLRKKSEKYSGICNVCGMRDSHASDECIYNFKSSNFANGRMSDRKPEERRSAFNKFRNSTPEHKAFYDKWERENPPKSFKMLLNDIPSNESNEESSDEVEIQTPSSVSYGSMVHAMEPRNIMCSAEEMNGSVMGFNKMIVQPQAKLQVKQMDKSPKQKETTAKSIVHPIEASNYDRPDKNAKVSYTGIVSMFEDGALIQTYDHSTKKHSCTNVKLDITSKGNLTLSIAWDTMVLAYASRHKIQPNDINEYQSYAGILNRLESGTPLGLDFSIPAATHLFKGQATIVKDWRLHFEQKSNVAYKDTIDWSKRKESITIQ